jgi:hypothetical protein
MFIGGFMENRDNVSKAKKEIGKKFFFVRIFLTLQISTVLLPQPLNASEWTYGTDIQTNRFSISTKSIHTGFSVNNEGALAVNENYVYVFHRTGEIQILNISSQEVELSQTSIPFQDFAQRAFGERGLPGVKGAFYDQFRKTLFVSSTVIINECAYLGVYSIFVENAMNLAQPKLIFLTPNCAPIPVLSETTGDITASNRQNQPNISQAGGKIVADKKHRIFLSIGNFGDAWRSKKVLDSAKNNSKDLFGKIIELRDINLKEIATYRVFATGFRNPSGLTVINKSGAIIEVENGPEGGDEINRVEFGKNYGWPYVSLGHPYSNSDGKYSFGKFPPYKQTTDYKNSMKPIFSWVPSIAPSNVVETPSSFSLNISGVDELVMGTYRDLSLHFLSISGNALISDEKVFLGYRIRDLTFSSNNTLVILDDNGNIHQLNFEPRKN